MVALGKIKFVVLGCGRIGNRYIELLHNNPNAEIVGLIDIKSPSDLSLPSNAPFFNTLWEFFASGIKPDIIIIATPNGLHAEQAITCLENDCHVLIEKPIALKSKDAEKIISTAEKTGCHAFAVMQNRYAGAAQFLKRLVDSGSLGNLYLAQANCFWNRDARYYEGHQWHGTRHLDGGALFTQFAHFVDMLHWLFGGIQNIHGRMANFNHGGMTEFEDTGLLNFEFTDGGLGAFNFTTAVWDKNFDSSLVIIAENGTIRVSGQYMDAIDYCHIKDRDFSPELLKLKEESGAAASKHHGDLLNDVVKVIRGEREYQDDAADGLAVVNIIERMNSQLKFSYKKSVV